jgi:hypothetical protein
VDGDGTRERPWLLKTRPAPRRTRCTGTRRPTRRRVTWSSDEARRFLECARQDDDPFYAAHVLVLVLGRRNGELLGLAWEGVDLDVARQGARASAYEDGVVGLHAAGAGHLRQRTSGAPAVNRRMEIYTRRRRRPHGRR